MRRYLERRQRHDLRPALFAELVAARDAGTLPGVDRDAALQIRERERRLAIAAEGRADQVEEGVVFADREQPSIARKEPGRREGEADENDFADVELRHIRTARGKCLAGRYRNSARGTAAGCCAPGSLRSSRWRRGR